MAAAVTFEKAQHLSAEFIAALSIAEEDKNDFAEEQPDEIDLGYVEELIDSSTERLCGFLYPESLSPDLLAILDGDAPAHDCYLHDLVKLNNFRLLQNAILEGKRLPLSLEGITEALQVLNAGCLPPGIEPSLESAEAYMGPEDESYQGSESPAEDLEAALAAASEIEDPLDRAFMIFTEILLIRPSAEDALFLAIAMASSVTAEAGLIPYQAAALYNEDDEDIFAEYLEESLDELYFKGNPEPLKTFFMDTFFECLPA